MDDNGLKSKEKEWEEETQSLWSLWSVDQKYKEVFHRLVCTCLSLRLLLQNAMDFSSLSEGITQRRFTLLISHTITELGRLSDTVRLMVPHISDDEFEQGFQSVISSFDSVFNGSKDPDET